MFSIKFSPDGKKVAMGAETVDIWNMQTAKYEHSISESVASLGWSVDGEQIASSELPCGLPWTEVSRVVATEEIA